MKIDHYIVRGGENLNSPARKTPGFPEKAETLFEKWHSKLGKDDREKENYFEMPVDGQTRLFIRSFWVEKLGHRPVCYYVGLLIEREAYMRAQEYFKLHKGICHISWQDIESAMEHNFAPIEFLIDFPVPRSIIGLDFSELSQMRLYGDEFDKNISEMCLSISVNSIEDWFGRLFIAVNPDRLDPAFHTIVSRKSPRAASPKKPTPIPPVVVDVPPNSPTPSNSRYRRFMVDFIIVLLMGCMEGCIIGILYDFHYSSKITEQERENEKKIASMKITIEAMDKTIEELKSDCGKLNTEVKTLTDKVNKYKPFEENYNKLREKYNELFENYNNLLSSSGKK